MIPPKSTGPFNNEILVGDAFGNREDVLICTKFGHKIVDGKPVPGGLDSSPQHIRKVCEESLKRLQRERIDVFYQHRFDPNIPIEEVAGACQDLIREEKFEAGVYARSLRKSFVVPMKLVL